MNLAGNQAKQLFKSLRTGGTPPMVALWAAATVVDQLRKRSRPERELIVSKKLKPGESYVIRMAGKGEASLTESVADGTSISTTDTRSEGSITAQLFSAAGDLMAAAAEPASEPTEEKSLSRKRRKAGGTVQRARETSESDPVTSTLVDVAASFLGSADAEPEAATARLSRRKRRRARRVATLDEAEFDRDLLPGRRLRKLTRAERRARKRPTRRRARRALRRQREATRATARLERRSRLSRRKRRRLRAAELEVEVRQAKVDRRSTRRRRRKLRKAEKQFRRAAT